MRRNKGFSMVELIIVIAIMAILAAALAPTLIRYIRKAQKTYDIDTGRVIGETSQAILAEEETYVSTLNAGRGTLVMSPYESFYKHNTTEVTCNTGGDDYTLVIVCNTQSNGQGKLEIRPGNNESQSFVQALNEQLGAGFKVRCKDPAGDGTKMTSYIVGYQKDNPNRVEVWIGSGNTSPEYILFPDQAPVYQTP
ncbi:MAG: prepilin-type N-terminal cleavage/methylation domain-containing protein [Lachnospiraceae bacterium]|nr:prepilin-type N-terminal cleavage/methylation domain-containing protein [Lachnospiraceae bacterium]